MFCRNCGTKINSTDKFCPMCGYSQTEYSTKKEIIEDNQIEYQINSVFNFKYEIISTSISSMIVVLLINIAFADVIDFWIGSSNALPFSIVIMIVFIVTSLILRKRQFQFLEYNFYKTKVEYKDKFLNKEQKELKYQYVREVTMSQNILERLCGIGTIQIYSNATSGIYTSSNNNNYQKNKNGIYIRSVENVQEKYHTIKHIIDEGISK